MGWTHDDLLRALIDQAPTHLVVLEGPDLRITHVTQAVVELVGRPMIGRTIREVLVGSPALEVIERVYATGRPETLHETPLYLPEPHHATRYFTRTFTPLKDRDGAVQAILVDGYDVTAMVQARKALEANELRSRDELQRMFALFEEAPVMLAVMDPPDWTLSSANRGLREMFAGRIGVGTVVSKFEPPATQTIATLERVYATGRAEAVEVTSQPVDRDGHTLQISFVPVRDRDGTIVHVMAAAVDVTEQRRARQKLESQTRDLERAREEAVAAGRAKDQFLAMLGHELRNPLQPMLTGVQVMRMDGDTSPALDMLEREVLHLTRLVDDLLDISQISRGVITLKREPLDIGSIISRGLELASETLEQRRHRVSTDVEHGNLGVSGDPHRLAQVVSNLIQNAAKYSAAGSQIRVVAKRENDRVILRISDDGVGIAADMLERVFDAFVQGVQPLDRSIGGLGIGLAIVRSLVEAHGGDVRALSDGPGCGSTFVVGLPAIEIGAAGRLASHANRAQRRDPPASPVHVLVVDDNVRATDSLEIGLTRLGHRVAVAYDGPSALILAKSDPPQIALLDIGLPVMDGYQLGEHLRAAHDIPIVAITGYGQPVDAERSRAAGFAAHLVKPVDIAELAELIEKLASARGLPS